MNADPESLKEILEPVELLTAVGSQRFFSRHVNLAGEARVMIFTIEQSLQSLKRIM